MGIRWEITGKFKWYFSPFVINGRSIEYHWEYFTGTYFDSVLMGVYFFKYNYKMLLIHWDINFIVDNIIK